MQTKTFRYDDSGNVQRIYSQAGDGGGLLAPGKTALSPSQCKADDLTLLATVTRYCYDEFNRQVFASGSGIDNPSLIAYDGLDRRSTKQNKLLGLETEMRSYAYLGASEVLTSEHYSRGLILKEERSHTYDYDSQGDRVGQATNAGASFRSYAKDANGSVTGLEDAAGVVATGDRYDYDPYGGLDRQGVLGNLEGACRLRRRRIRSAFRASPMTRARRPTTCMPVRISRTSAGFCRRTSMPRRLVILRCRPIR